MKKYLAILLTLAMTACVVTPTPDPGPVGPPEDPAVDAFILNARGAYDLTDTTPTTVSTLLVDTLAEGATYKVGDIIKKSDSTVMYSYTKQYDEKTALYLNETSTKYNVVEYDASVPTLKFLGDFTTPEEGDTAQKDHATTPILPSSDVPTVAPVNPFVLDIGSYEMPNNKTFKVTSADKNIYEDIDLVPTLSYKFVKGLSETQAIYSTADDKKFVGIQTSKNETLTVLSLYATDGDLENTWSTASGVRFTARHLYKDESGGISGGEYFTKLIYTGAKQFAGLGAATDKQELMDAASSIKVDGNEGAKAFRIPALLTIPGYSFITADLRYGAPADSAHNIDSVIRRSTDNGKTWEGMRIIQDFDDFAPTNLQEGTGGNYSSAAESASFIDPAIVYTPNGDLLTLTTTFPWNSGLMAINKGRGTSALASYFKKDDAIYLKLRFGTPDNANGGNNWRGKDGTESAYEYAVKVSDFKAGKNPIVKKDGTPATGAQLYYTVDKFYNLYYKGKAVMADQYATGRPDDANKAKVKVSPTKKIAVNLLYTASVFHPVPTSYIFLAKSTDKGNTWDEPYDITWQFDNKPSETLEPTKNKLDLSTTAFLGSSPGVGYVIKEGTYKGRVLLALQQSPGDQQCTAFSIYSDDNGETWSSGERVSRAADGGRRSESQYIEAPDNQLLLVHRNDNYLVYSTSKDGGVTWAKITTPVDANGVKINNMIGDNAMVGASNLRRVHYYNQPMFAISIATGNGRSGGKVYVGFLELKNGFWDMNFSVNGANVALPWNPEDSNEKAAYSSVAELNDGSLGLFYEGAGYGGGGTIGSTISFARFPVTTK